MTGSPHEQHGHCPELLDTSIELLPASCTPDSPRPWASRVELGPIDEDEPVPSASRKRRIFLACGCILGNELCERLAFYGLSTNMGLYLKKVMGYPADRASQLLQVWKATVYVTPLLGAYLADAVMGRFWVILVFSLIYFVGMLGITMVNLIPGIKPGSSSNGTTADATSGVFWASMYLTALGGGGIKPCVSSFGGDQFKETSARERAWRSSFFNYFYFTINIGALVASTVVVGVQEVKGYGVGFGIPTAAFMAAICLFIAGAVANLYVRVPPEGSPFRRIFRVFRAAFANRRQPLPVNPHELYEPVCGADDGHGVPFKMAHTQRMRCLDKAAIVAPAAAGVQLTSRAHASSSNSSSRGASQGFHSSSKHSSSSSKDIGSVGSSSSGSGSKDAGAVTGTSTSSRSSKDPAGATATTSSSSSSSSSSSTSSLLLKCRTRKGRAPVSVSEVEETKAFLGIMPLFLCICIYQMASDPISTLLPYTGDAMDRRLNSHTVVPASSVSFTNTFGVLGMVVFYDLVIAPLAARWLGRPISMTMRIGLGFVIQIVALLSAAFIEVARYRVIKTSGVLAAFEAAGPGADPLDPAFTQPMSIWWQAIPYFLSGASEVFTNIGCMELFYTNVSEGMRSLGTSVYLLSISVGMYLAGALNMAVAAAAPHDPWLANNTLYGHYDRYYFLNAGILMAGLVAYVLIARNYTEKPLVPMPMPLSAKRAAGRAGGQAAAGGAAGDMADADFAPDAFKAA